MKRFRARARRPSGCINRTTRLRLTPIPAWLRNHTNLRWLYLSDSEVTGGIPAWLGNHTHLQHLYLGHNELTGSIPRELGSLASLESFDVGYNWGVSGSLPPGLRQSRLEELDILLSQTCAPVAWRDWLETIEFTGRLCESGTDVTIDVAVVYTPAAREAAGGAAAIEAVIDLMVSETNQAYEASGVRHRVALADRSEVQYSETGDSSLDLGRLQDPADGHMDGVHALRDEVGADLVHLIVSEAEANSCGRAYIPGVFGLTGQACGGPTFAHELGHNMGLLHDRYQELDDARRRLRSHPAYGYVNQRAFEPDAPLASRWRTIMSYPTQCDDAGFRCSRLLGFSNPRLQYNGDPLGIPYAAGAADVTGPADAVAVLNATGPAVALWRARIPGRANQPPAAVGNLASLTIGVAEAPVVVEVAGAFRDPDGDRLTYGASSSAPSVAWVSVAGSRVTVTPVAVGTATVTVTATDTGGSSTTATQTFTVTVGPASNRPPVAVGRLAPVTIGVDDGAVSVDVAGAFRDPDGDRLTYGGSSSAPSVAWVSVAGSRVTVTPVAVGTATVTVTATDTGGSNTTATQTFRVTVPRPFTDHPIVPGVTPVKAVHFTELRMRIDSARTAVGLGRFPWTDPVLSAGVTRVRLVHLLELRSALGAAYRAAGRSAPSWTNAVPTAGTTAIRAAHLMELRTAVVALERGV